MIYYYRWVAATACWGFSDRVKIASEGNASGIPWYSEIIIPNLPTHLSPQASARISFGTTAESMGTCSPVRRAFSINKATTPTEGLWISNQLEDRGRCKLAPGLVVGEVVVWSQHSDPDRLPHYESVPGSGRLLRSYVVTTERAAIEKQRSDEARGLICFLYCTFLLFTSYMTLVAIYGTLGRAGMFSFCQDATASLFQK